MTRVAITGIGIVSPFGGGRSAALESLRNARSGVRLIRSIDASALNCRIAGEVPEAQPDYPRAMERLQQSAQKLRESVQAMGNQPAGPRRNAAARQAREAIVETQQAMIDLPPPARSQAGAKSASGAGSIASSIPKTFSELDRNNDGFLDMVEAASDKDAQQNFKALDKNGDYKLSRSEWEAGHPPAAGGSPAPRTSPK